MSGQRCRLTETEWYGEERLEMYLNYIFDFYGTLAHIRTDEEKPYLWEKMSEIYAALGARYTAEERRETFRSLEQKERDKIGTEDAEPDLTKVFALLYAGRHLPFIGAGMQKALSDFF